MHLANAYYGHADILRRYSGAAPRRPVGGMLQHGWNQGTGFTPHDPPLPVRRVLPCFVWNRDNLERAGAEGFGVVTAIGAPFLYLQRLVPRSSAEPDGTPRVIAYPFHAWEREDTTGGSHGDYARELAEREGPVTVCLYWVEHDDPTVREAYAARGHRVVCHGRREDPGFLGAQLGELGRHRRMVTNRISTAVWYAGAVGLEVELYGPEMGLGSRARLGKEYDQHRRRWPELFAGGAVTPGDAASLARRELGGEFVREPEELARLLGFRGRRRAVAALAPLTRTLMRVKKRIEGW